MFGQFLWLFEWDTHIVRAGENASISLLALVLFVLHSAWESHMRLWTCQASSLLLTYILGQCLSDAGPAVMRFETACLGSSVYTRILVSLIQTPKKSPSLNFSFQVASEASHSQKERSGPPWTVCALTWSYPKAYSAQAPAASSLHFLTRGC